MQKKYFIRTLLLFLSLCFPLLSCQKTDAGSISTEEQEFIQFADALFVQAAASDSLSLNYTLAEPENYGITALPNGFSTFSYADLEKDALTYENLYSQTAAFDDRSFSRDSQILHRTLLDTLELRIRGQDHIAFTESLGPVTGIQAQLPVLLAEFRIDDRNDLEQYFCILKTLPDYFRSLLSLEEEKSRRHTLPCRQSMQHIIDQCESFLEESGTTMLEKTFEKRLEDCSFLEEEEKQKAIEQNKSCINQYVHPAYHELIQGLKKLLPLAGENGSLSSYPNGEEYYRYLVRQTTGSSLSPEDLRSLMSTRLTEANDTLLAYARKDPSLFSSCYRYINRYATPEKVLSTLQERMTKDFPPLDDTDYEIKYVDEALRDYLSPAFYLTPPIDDNSRNVIYINPSDSYDISSLFNTLAHEGYPGHLYQTCYLQNRGCHNLRHILNYGGYTEGWASYAEIYAYKYTGVSKEEVGILRNNMIATLCLYGLCDIGVHFEGWNLENLTTFLNRYGSYSSESVSSLYANLVDEPASYLKYTVGYLEICRLKDTAREIWDSSYSEKAFHTFLLEIGPTSFDILRDYLADYPNN